MIRILLFAVLCSFSSFSQTLDFLAPGGPLILHADHSIGFTTRLSWPNVSGTYDVQRAFYNDYSDAVTIYTGTANSYTDLESVFTGNCYYRIRKDGGSWVNKSINITISDNTEGTRACFNGNSITFGSNATDPATQGFANLFYKVKNWTAQVTGDNRGISGNAITPEASPPVTLWDYDSGPNIMAPKTLERNYLFNGFGVNDGVTSPILSLATADQYRIALENWVDYCVTVGWPLNRIIIFGPFIQHGNETRLVTFRDAARTAASNKRVGFLSVYDKEVADNFTLDDGVHPTTAEHRILADWLADRIDNPGLPPTTPTITEIVVVSQTVLLVKFNTHVEATNVGWSFKKNGGANNPTAVSGSGSTILRFTIPAVAAGDVITYSYDQSTGNTLSFEKIYNVEIPTVTDQAVTNAIPSSYDTDAQAIFTAIEGTGETLSDDEKSLYNVFVVNMKADGLWAKMKAFWFLGGSLNKSKFNFKDPQDLDASFRLAQVGTVTYASDGATGGSTANNYLNTNFNPSSNVAFRDDLSLYFSQLGTSVAGTKCAMGSISSAASGHYVMIPTTGALTEFSMVFNNSPGFLNKNNPVSRGRYLASRTSSTGWSVYKNGALLYARTATSVASSNSNISICGNFLPSDQKQSCAGIFSGLTSGEAALLEDNVSSLEIGLNRN
jgi:lysophospholipase L1-like esterase